MTAKVVLHTFHIKPISPVAFILPKILFSLGKKNTCAHGHEPINWVAGLASWRGSDLTPRGCDRPRWCLGPSE